MSQKIIVAGLLVSALISFGFISQCSPDQQESNSSPHQQSQSEEVPELAEYMSTMQHYTHKFSLAVAAENQELAQFYFHEIRALSDEIKEDIPGYEGYDIARFMRLFMDPAIPPVEEALTGTDWTETRRQVQELVNSCNTCHNATAHGFVKVTPGFDKNPYNQDFSQ